MNPCTALSPETRTPCYLPKGHEQHHEGTSTSTGKTISWDRATPASGWTSEDETK